MSAILTAQTGPLKGLILELKDATEWIIGSDPTVDFVLEDETVSGKHALIKMSGDDLTISNLSAENPLLVNEDILTEPHFLKSGDHVQIGDTDFLFSEKTEEKASTAYDSIFEDEDTEPPTEKITEEPEQEKTAYDTIFEDVEEYEDVPFNLTADSSLILKVIAGPNAGAEIGLQKGRSYVLGKDTANSDIVLNDMSVSKSHAKITILENGTIDIEDLSSKNGTMVNGSEISEKKIITSQDLIQMGTTTFLIIDRETEVETLYAPRAAEYTPVEEEKEEIEEKVEAPKKSLPWKKQIIPMKHLVMAGSFVVVFFVIFLSFFSLFKPESHIAKTKDFDSQIHDVTKKFSDITFNFAPSTGKIFLVGHVLTPVRHQELTYELGNLPFITSIDDNVVVDEFVWREMNDVLVENAGFKGVSIHSNEPGKFVITGYLNSVQQLERLDDYLTSNFAYTNRLKNLVIVESELSLIITQMVHKSGFPGLGAQVTNGMVSLAGRYDKKEQIKYDRLRKEIGRIPGVRGVKNIAMATSEFDARIDLSKKYQVSGFAKHDKMNYSVVVNGQILTVGENLDSMHITKILPTAVLLEKDGLRYKIDYTRR